MLKIRNLNLGLMDATSYVTKKTFFNEIFFVDDYINLILHDETYFIVGDKGTGKTAYGLYFQNNEIENTLSSIILDISSTGITNFKKMMDNKLLMYSSLKDVWELILYVEITKLLLKHKPFQFSMQCSANQKKLNEALQSYEKLAFNPDMVATIKTQKRGTLIAKFTTIISSSIGKEMSTTENAFHLTITDLRRTFEDCFESLELEKNIILFVDGIDIIPEPFDQESYVHYLVDLINASLNLNQNVFSNLKSKKTNMKVMLLLRPDVFQLTTAIKNWNLKKYDNTVNLNWIPQTEYIQDSRLFKVIDKLLSVQQDDTNTKTTYLNYYFPQECCTSNKQFSFEYLLDYTFLRPRDIIFLLQKMQNTVIEEELDASHFEEHHFNKSYNKYCEYLFEDIKEQVLLKYKNEDFEKLQIFFSFLRKTIFDSREYKRAFNSYCSHIENENAVLPAFASKSSTFLEFLYMLNVIGFKNKNSNEEYKWYFIEKERFTVNQSIKQKNSEYCIHKGLANIIKNESNIGRKRYQK